jgi:hypothetical protein
MGSADAFRTCIAWSADDSTDRPRKCSEPTEYLVFLGCENDHHKLVSVCARHKQLVEHLPAAALSECEMCEEGVAALPSPMALLGIEDWDDHHEWFQNIDQDAADIEAIDLASLPPAKLIEPQLRHHRNDK